MPIKPNKKTKPVIKNTVPTAAAAAPLQWSRALNANYFVNSSAISGDGAVMVAGTFFHSYSRRDAAAPVPNGDYGTYCFDRNGNLLWSDVFNGYQGVYWTAVSASGAVAASGGWFSQQPYLGFIRAYSAATGAQLLNYNPPARVNDVALSADGSTLVAASDKVYLFQQSNDVFPATPAVFALDNQPNASSPNCAQSIAIAANGGWFVVADYMGKVYLIENRNGQIGNVYTWSEPTQSPLHSIAMSATGEWFVVGGNDSRVYLFLVDLMIPELQPAGSCALDNSGSVYGVSISADGSRFAALGNSGETGAVYAFQNDRGVPTRIWKQATLRNPNYTTMDAAGSFITVADGHPDATPGHFYLFDGASGTPLWRYDTNNMSWAMSISADASGIIAGSDTGSIYYFTVR